MTQTSATAQTKGSKKMFLSIASGRSTTPWYAVGSKIGEVVSRYLPDIDLASVTGANAGNPKDIENGIKDFAFAYTCTISDALAGNPPYEKKYQNIRIISVLYPTYLQIFSHARSGIKSVRDLLGKKVAVGMPGTNTEVIAKRLLEGLDLTFEDLKKSGGKFLLIGYEDAKQALADGQLDAGFWSSTIPVKDAVELQLQHDIRLLDLDPKLVEKIANKYNDVFVETIPANVYKNQPKSVLSLATPGAIMVRKDLNEETVYKVTKAIWEHWQEIAEVHATTKKEFKPENALKGFDKALLHPGARKYYVEKGMLK